MTASTGKAAPGISDITLHSAFHLPVTSKLKSYEYKKPSDETLHMLRNKHQYLNVLIIDQMPMIGREKFRPLNLLLKAIMRNFLQVSPLNQKGIFMKPHKGPYRSFNGWLWEKVQLHELVAIMQ